MAFNQSYIYISVVFFCCFFVLVNTNLHVVTVLSVIAVVLTAVFVHL